MQYVTIDRILDLKERAAKDIIGTIGKIWVGRCIRWYFTNIKCLKYETGVLVIYISMIYTHVCLEREMKQM